MKFKTIKILSCFIISIIFTIAINHNVKAATNFVVTNTTELTQAISDSVNGDSIEFQNFTDTLSSTLNISKSLTFTHATPGFALKVSGNFSHMTIYSANAVLNFNNVILDGNNVGGGIFKPGIGGTLTIDGVQITKSTNVNGGAINVARDTNLTLSDSLLNYNTASSGGDAIYTGIDSIVNISDSFIDHNTANGATESGGGAYFGIGSDVIITNTEITYNSGVSRGGGVYLGKTNATIEFINSTLAHNNIGIQGGALYADENAVARFTNSVVDNNTSSTYSAGILITTNATLYFSGGAITNNTALTAAGGIGAFNANAKVYMQGGTNITGNTANTGGGIYVQQATGLASIIDTDFNNNRALTGDGGAIYTANLNNVDVDALSLFSNNQAVSSTSWTVGSAEMPTTSTIHNNHINSTSFTSPFTNAYNNYDINFKPKKVNFLANGGTGTTQFVNAEQTGIVTIISSPFTPPVGKGFVRWNNQADGNSAQNYLPSQTLIMGNTDLNFYAIYEDLVQYKVMFNLNGGDSNFIDDQLLYYGDAIVQPSDPTKTGFTFYNWNTSIDGSGTTWNFTTNTMPANDVTLYAQWNINQYKLNFNLNGGDGVAPTSQDVDFDSLATEPTMPQKQGYSFIGWNTTQDGSGSTWSFTNTPMPANDVTLYAQWSINQYKLNFDLNGGDGIAPISQDVDFDSLATEPTMPQKQGYSFIEWNTMQDGSGSTWNFTNTTMPANDVTLYAKWKKNIDPIVDYILRFDLNGGQGIAPKRQLLSEGLKAIKPANPTRDGYVFKEWNTIKNGSGQTWFFNSSTMPAKDVTLYAQWSKKDLPYTGNSSNVILLSALLTLAGIMIVAVSKKKYYK